MNFLQNPVINLAHVCLLLYGKNDKATRSKLYNKIKGHQGKHFTAEELSRLEQIRQQIIAELTSLQ